MRSALRGGRELGQARWPPPTKERKFGQPPSLVASCLTLLETATNQLDSLVMFLYSTSATVYNLLPMSSSYFTLHNASVPRSSCCSLVYSLFPPFFVDLSASKIVSCFCPFCTLSRDLYVTYLLPVTLFLVILFFQ